MNPLVEACLVAMENDKHEVNSTNETCIQATQATQEQKRKRKRDAAAGAESPKIKHRRTQQDLHQNDILSKPELGEPALPNMQAVPRWDFTNSSWQDIISYRACDFTDSFVSAHHLPPSPNAMASVHPQTIFRNSYPSIGDNNYPISSSSLAGVPYDGLPAGMPFYPASIEPAVNQLLSYQLPVMSTTSRPSPPSTASKDSRNKDLNEIDARLTPHLHLKQNVAAKKLGMSTSRVCKEWGKYSKHKCKPNKTMKWPAGPLLKIQQLADTARIGLQNGQICDCAYNAIMYALAIERKCRLCACDCMFRNVKTEEENAGGKESIDSKVRKDECEENESYGVVNNFVES